MAAAVIQEARAACAEPRSLTLGRLIDRLGGAHTSSTMMNLAIFVCGSSQGKGKAFLDNVSGLKMSMEPLDIIKWITLHVGATDLKVRELECEELTKKPCQPNELVDSDY